MSDRPTVDHTPFPVYSALVTQWVQAGRTVPGMPDREWERIMATPVWPRH
ncbi:hypothetical protein ACFW96_07310 [Streptomyces gardneri]